MKNAHTRIGGIELSVERKATYTRVRAFFDRFAKEGTQTHMVSLFGNDAEIAAFSAGIATGIPLTATTPDGEEYTLNLGEKPVTYRGHIQIPGRPKPVRHLLALSQSLLQNGMDGKVYLLESDPNLMWTTIVSFLGLPATPEWATEGVRWLSESGKIKEMQGHRCSPVVVTANREELLAWIGEGVRSARLPFPKENGPIIWPRYSLADILPVYAGTNESSSQLPAAA